MVQSYGTAAYVHVCLGRGQFGEGGEGADKGMGVWVEVLIHLDAIWRPLVKWRPS